MRTLKSYLGIPDRLDDQLTAVDGSCQWINERDDFQTWKDTTIDELIEETEEGHKNPAVFWVYAKPGTGKTFLAAHVGNMLRQFQSNCASYFFHHGKKTSLSLGDLLSSLAYQLAATNPIIRETLVAIREEGSTFDIDDARTIWTLFFKQGIFQVSSHSFRNRKRSTNIFRRHYKHPNTGSLTRSTNARYTKSSSL